MMLVVGWWESDMPAKHTQKIRAMDSGVLLTAYDILITCPVLQGDAPARQKGRSGSANDPQPVPATTRSRLRSQVPQANTSKGPEPDRSKCPSGLTRKITPKNKP